LKASLVIWFFVGLYSVGIFFFLFQTHVSPQCYSFACRFW
jgi:hypothetical protein